MADSLRDYFVRFLFRTDKTGAKEAQTAIDGLTRKLEKLGGLSFVLNEVTGAVGNIIAPFRQLGSFVDGIAREADALGDLSDRTGIATEKLEGYAFMAKLAGTSSEVLLTGLKKLEINMGEALGGGKEAQETFAKLGIRLRDVNGHVKKTDQLLPEVAKAFEKIPSHAERTALAVKLFGRAGQELLPFLSKGEKAIRAMQEELVALGGTTSEDFLKASSDYADNADKMAAVWKGIKQAFAGPIVDALNKGASAFIEWWKAAGALIRSKIGEWAFQLVTSVQALWTTVKKLSTGLLILVAALNAPMLAMIGLRALIALIIDDFANWMAGNDSLIGRAIKNWDDWLAELRKTNPVLAEVMRFFGGVVDWLHSGIVKLGKDWDKFIAEFDNDTIGHIAKGAWETFKEFFFKPFTDTLEALKNFDLGELWARAKYDVGLRYDAPRKQEMKVLPNGAAAALAAPPGGAGATNNSSVNAPVQITINGMQGNARENAQEINDIVDRALDRAIRQGHADTVPEAY